MTGALGIREDEACCTPSAVPSPAGFAGVLSPCRERRILGAGAPGGIPAFAGMTRHLGFMEMG